MRGGELDGLRITRVDMAKDTHSGIAGENATQSSLGIFSAVGNNHHAGVLRETDADAAAVMDRYP